MANDPNQRIYNVNYLKQETHVQCDNNLTSGSGAIGHNIFSKITLFINLLHLVIRPIGIVCYLVLNSLHTHKRFGQNQTTGY